MVAPLGILLVEDSPADSRLLVESLRERVNDGSVVIQTVRRLADALRELKRFRFSCVLVDLGLPDGDGVAHVARIREADPGVAIVVLTGLADQNAASEAFRLGAQDYLIKGQRLGDELLDFVRHAIAKSGRASPGGEPSAAAAATPGSLRFQPWVDLFRARYVGVHATLAANSEVMVEALAAARSWQDGGIADIVLALSMPSEALEDALDRLPSRMDRAGLTANQIMLRFRGVDLQQSSPLLDTLRRLRGQGMRIWLEGWSPSDAGLQRLLHLPLDGLVLDADFVSVLAREPVEPDLRFLRASLALASSLHLDVLADGVALAEQHLRLAALGCRYLEGPWYGTPEPASEIAQRWRRGPSGLDGRFTREAS